LTELRHKIKNALDEGRTLVLGAQVLLGFEFRSFFEQSFEQLPMVTRYLKAGALGCLLIAIIVLFVPASFHRIVERGEDTERLHRVSTKFITWALLPFGLGMGIDAFVLGEKVWQQIGGIVAGICVTAAALFFWYGLEWLARNLKFGEGKMRKPKEEEEEKLNTKIEHVLQEIRMVLPGVQALLGFQMATSMMQSFESLPESSKVIHFAALLMIALSTIFLMTPPAYHRLVERGENTDRFHRCAGRFLLAAMISLPLGIAGDVLIVVRKLTESVPWAIASGILALLMAWGFWFGLTALRKNADTHRSTRLREARSSA
jgi:hypothetical protein